MPPATLEGTNIQIVDMLENKQVDQNQVIREMKFKFVPWDDSEHQHHCHEIKDSRQSQSQYLKRTLPFRLHPLLFNSVRGRVRSNLQDGLQVGPLESTEAWMNWNHFRTTQNGASFGCPSWGSATASLRRIKGKSWNWVQTFFTQVSEVGAKANIH